MTKHLISLDLIEQAQAQAHQLETRVAELEQQVKNLLNTLEIVTLQVSHCNYCGQPFQDMYEQRLRDTSTDGIVHAACFEELLKIYSEGARRERQAEIRNEEALYGYEVQR